MADYHYTAPAGPTGELYQSLKDLDCGCSDLRAHID